MNYNMFKERVSEIGLFNSNQARNFIIRVLVLLAFLALAVSILTMAMVSTVLGGIVMIMFGILFVFLLDYATESEENLILINKISKLCWLSPILCAGVVSVLHFVLGVI